MFWDVHYLRMGLRECCCPCHDTPNLCSKAPVVAPAEGWGTYQCASAYHHCTGVHRSPLPPGSGRAGSRKPEIRVPPPASCPFSHSPARSDLHEANRESVWCRWLANYITAVPSKSWVICNMCGQISQQDIQELSHCKSISKTFSGKWHSSMARIGVTGLLNKLTESKSVSIKQQSFYEKKEFAQYCHLLLKTRIKWSECLTQAYNAYKRWERKFVWGGNSHKWRFLYNVASYHGA